MTNAPLEARLSALRALVSTFPSVLIGYSGGVDSACLAVVLRQELGRDRMLAVIGRSASYPLAQWQAARDAAAQFDVPLLEVDTHELDDPEYAANPTNRCFFCKRELWTRLTAVARDRGLAVVCDGTIADDVHEHRPGRAAGEQAEIRSPLAEVEMTKEDVRAVARSVGLSIWNAPAAPCLSSRVMYGLAITPSRLSQVEAAEAYLRSLGVSGDLRVRHRGDRARIEAEPVWIAWLMDRLGAITERLVALGFPAVEIDPRGYRRGSLILETTGER
jgi:pyridinium-3,5-biscarboxylic acid mononucleotide sulfurtransferase